MKKIPRIIVPAFLTAALFAAGASARAQEMPVSPEPDASSPAGITTEELGVAVREIRILPTDKRALALKEEERNPYAQRISDITIEEIDAEEETESDKIRRLLTGIPVTGRTYGRRGIRLLAGDIIFETGREVPRVLEDQTEKLMVENITEDQLTLAWIDPETGEPTGRVLSIKYDMNVVVGYKLAGQTSNREADSEDAKFGTLRRSSDLPAEVAEESNELKRSRDVAGEEEDYSEYLKQGQ